MVCTKKVCTKKILVLAVQAVKNSIFPEPEVAVLAVLPLPGTAHYLALPAGGVAASSYCGDASST